MKKVFQRLFSSALVLSFCLSIPFAANATSLSAVQEPVSEKDVLFTVEVNSEEELNDFLADLAAHNKKAKELWAQALAESNYKIEKIESIEKSEIAPMAIETSTAATDVKFGNLTGYLGAYVSYDKVERKFGTVNGFYMYGLDSDTAVSNVNYESTKIDNDRTLAVNSTSLIGVRNGAGGMSYFPYEAYIEFYTDGTGNFY
ncbi:hypothetical protein [Brevibacillus sp. MS2.2]|uniref:hypothetical protein n=1 Tax=Brevibacillus sp. MS2.2 TaxID=2738981 RepID=UPI00156B641E|nr:hypothetical protein [Brevibacillus sp. MS2.2]NRR21350.1 hypothetical protein [Brevibacillus sp. MS2.2]